MKKIVILLTLLSLYGCDTEFEVRTNNGNSDVNEKIFESKIEGPTPWTHSQFDNTNEKFTFAVFSDLNGGERERIFEVAVAQLALLRPELIMSIGDLIDGDSEDRSALIEEWQWFDQRASRTQAPVFYVGGNHDLTNKVMQDLWSERYGPKYYHFIYKNVLFLALDTEDYSEKVSKKLSSARAAFKAVQKSGDLKKASQMEYMRMPERLTGDVSGNQVDYFLKVLAENPDVHWTFLFMHKPVWLKEEEPDFLALEDALSNRPYTLFNGHLHTYSHHVRKGRDYIMLGTTGGAHRPNQKMSFDHLTLVTVDREGPTIVNLKLEGILDKTGEIPEEGQDLCFQALECKKGG